MKYTFTSFANNMLLAMPKLNGGLFEKAVILICEHDETGAVGIMINKIYDISVAEVLTKMNITSKNKELKNTPVVAGGPVKPDKGFVLYSDYNNSQHFKSTKKIADDLIICYSEDIMKAIANDLLPEPYILALGYCEWTAGQLEQELANNDWLTAPADLDIIFEVPFEDIWSECTQLLGIQEIHNLSQHGGHA
jgi:putative transcriptional regulator